MVDFEIVQEWLEKAHEDFEFALVNFQERRPFYAQMCFHFHQAAEKYLKSHIIANELEFRKIHDLPVLLKVCLEKDPSLAELQEACEYLNTFYIETRYPVHWPTNYDQEEAQKAKLAAEHIRDAIKDKLKSFLTRD